MDDEIYFQVLDKEDNLIAEIQVFSDLHSWVSSDTSHRVIIGIDDDDDYIDCYEEEFTDDIEDFDDDIM